MKKLFTLIVFCMTAISTWAYDVEVDGIFYNLYTEAKTAEVTYKTYNSASYSGSVTIPETIVYSNDNYTVNEIGCAAFAFCSDLTNIAIPNTINRIGGDAFRECRNLTSLTIPYSVMSIESLAFDSCTSLTSITIPCTVTLIGDGVLSNCSGLTSVSVESGNPYYDSRDNCNAIIETSTNQLVSGCSNTLIPDGITTLKYCSFTGSTGLTSITIPNSVTSIEDFTFDGCTGLSLVTCYAENVPTMGSYVFQNVDTSSATLKVPEASIEQYKTTAPWSSFGTILPIEDTGINAVMLTPSNGQIYNISGQKASSSARGILIRDGKKYISK